MAKISYPTASIVDQYLKYNAPSGIANDLGYARSNNLGFTLRPVAKLPVFTDVYRQNLNCFMGIDYPCLISPDPEDITSASPDGIGKTIAIIGQDPRRTKSDPWYNNPGAYFNPKVCSPNYNSEVVIGLPWAVNNCSYPRVKAVSVYLINNLLARGFSVYVTDIFKLFKTPQNPKLSNYQLFLKSLRQNDPIAKCAVGLLGEELSVIQPVKTMCFFDPDPKIFKGMQTGCVVRAPHPSGRNRNWPILLNNVAVTDQNKGSYLSELM